MLPLLLLLLVQGISAVEFPNLASHFSLIWNNVNVSSQLTVNQPENTNERTWTFTLCGPLNSKESTVNCSVEYYTISSQPYDLKDDGTPIYRNVANSKKKAIGVAGKIPRSGSGPSCWLFQNPDSEDLSLYKPRSDIVDWKVEYTCYSSDSYPIELPNLSSHISLVWDNVNISKQINADRTVSFKGDISVFTLCGLKNSRGSSANCSITYQGADRKVKDNGEVVVKWIPISDSVIGVAGKIPKGASEDSCWQFNNPKPPQKWLSEASDYISPKYDWIIQYTCTTLAFDESSTAISDSNTNTTSNGGSNILLILVLICFALIVGALVGFKLGGNTKAKGLNSSMTLELRSKV